MNEMKEVQKALNDTFIKGRCFICRQEKEMDKEAYCHYSCGQAYMEKKKEVINESLK
jgi:hypothetical protein